MPETPTCDEARGWASAFHDGEAMPDAVLRAHIDGCADCAGWERSMADLGRRAAVSAVDAPDVTGSALAAWRARPSATLRRQLLVGRAILAVAGVAGLLLSALAITGSSPSPHLGQDVAALEGALAIGYLLAASRPDRYGAALLPVVGIAGLLTLLGAQPSFGTSATNLLAEASHIPAVIGFAGLFVVLDARGGVSVRGGGEPQRP